MKAKTRDKINAACTLALPFTRDTFPSLAADIVELSRSNSDTEGERIALRAIAKLVSFLEYEE